MTTVGARVSVTGKVAGGTIRFVGATEFDPTGTWVGVELDLPEGKNDGSKDGVEYFSCAPAHGTLQHFEPAACARGAAREGANSHAAPAHRRSLRPAREGEANAVEAGRSVNTRRGGKLGGRL